MLSARPCIPILALLVSTRFTQPFNEPIVYGKSIARLANVLGEDIIVQRLGDLRRPQDHERATGSRYREPTLADATPGTSVSRFPYRHLQDIIDMLGAMDRLMPGVAGRDTLLYGVEVKFYSSRLSWMPAYRPTSPACMRWEMGLVSHGAHAGLGIWSTGHGQFWRNMVSVERSPVAGGWWWDVSARALTRGYSEWVTLCESRPTREGGRQYHNPPPLRPSQDVIVVPVRSDRGRTVG